MNERRLIRTLACRGVSHVEDYFDQALGRVNPGCGPVYHLTHQLPNDQVTPDPLTDGIRHKLDEMVGGINRRNGRGSLTVAMALQSKAYLDHDRTPFGKPGERRWPEPSPLDVRTIVSYLRACLDRAKCPMTDPVLKLRPERRYLVRNAVRCKQCGEEIESRHRHHHVKCGCGNASVDGGLVYARRSCGPAGFVELARYADRQ